MLLTTIKGLIKKFPFITLDEAQAGTKSINQAIKEYESLPFFQRTGNRYENLQYIYSLLNSVTNDTHFSTHVSCCNQIPATKRIILYYEYLSECLEDEEEFVGILCQLGMKNNVQVAASLLYIIYRDMSLLTMEESGFLHHILRISTIDNLKLIFSWLEKIDLGDFSVHLNDIKNYLFNESQKKSKTSSKTKKIDFKIDKIKDINKLFAMFSHHLLIKLILEYKYYPEEVAQFVSLHLEEYTLDNISDVINKMSQESYSQDEQQQFKKTLEGLLIQLKNKSSNEHPIYINNLQP